MIGFGQRIQCFEIIMENDAGIASVHGTTVGRKRIITFPVQKVKTILLKIVQAKAVPVINEIAVYKIEEKLIETVLHSKKAD